MILFGSLGLNGSTLMLTGLWASLQFRWVLIRHAQVVPPVERLLLATAMPVAMAIQSWGIIGAVGMDIVAFPVMAIGCGLYALCMQPLPSSFQRPVHHSTPSPLKQSTPRGQASEEPHLQRDRSKGSSKEWHALSRCACSRRCSIWRVTWR